MYGSVRGMRRQRLTLLDISLNETKPVLLSRLNGQWLPGCHGIAAGAVLVWVCTAFKQGVVHINKVIIVGQPAVGDGFDDFSGDLRDHAIGLRFQVGDRG